MFQQIPSFPAYEVSTNGQVRTIKTGRLRVLALHNGKYFRVTLRRDGKTYQPAVHLLMLETFVGPRPPGHEGRHLNGKSKENWLGNLAWGTKSENTADKVKHGSQKGELNPAAKLTEAQVTEIVTNPRKLLQRQLGAKFGVSASHVSAIQSGKFWT